MTVPLRLTITPRALKDLQWLPPDDRARVRRRIEAYAATPDDARHDIIPLVGRMSGLRLRVGDWRVIIHRDEDRAEVLRVLHRREAYR